MIDEGIAKGKYEKTEDNTVRDLQSFRSFLHRNFKDCKNDIFKFKMSDQRQHQINLLPSSQLPKRTTLTILKTSLRRTVN